MSDTFERVKAIVVEHLGVDPAKVVESASYLDDLGSDSLDLVELVMKFEEAFDCEISDEDSAKATTIKSTVEMIDKFIADKKA